MTDKTVISVTPIAPVAPPRPLSSGLADNLFWQNIVSVKLLMLCPMLAVSVSVQSALLLSALTLLVMAVAGGFIALIRRHIIPLVRIPVFMVIIATLVAVMDMTTEAFLHQQHQQLGIFLPLIITNCGVLARIEVFASKQPPLAATLDGISTGLGMMLVLTLLATLRELIGRGQIAGIINIPHFSGIPFALHPAGGFLLFALLLAVLNWGRARAT